MEFTAEVGEQRYAALVRAAAETVVGLDFDGTLAPIVEDPSEAHIHPDAGQVLVDLAEQVLAVAVVTGRPARQALDLGGLGAGRQRDRRRRQGAVPLRPVRQRALVLHEPPGDLAPAAARAGVVHRRGAPAAAPAGRRGRPHRGEGAGGGGAHPPAGRPRARPSRRCCPRSSELAARYDLVVEPGRQVVEVRSPGMHKGIVVERLVDELHAGGFVFVGDDLGDLEAFEAVAALGERRPAHPPGLLGLRRGERPGPALRRSRPRPRRRPRPPPPAHRRRGGPPGLSGRRSGPSGQDFGLLQHAAPRCGDHGDVHALLLGR